MKRSCKQHNTLSIERNQSALERYIPTQNQTCKASHVGKVFENLNTLLYEFKFREKLILEIDSSKLYITQRIRRIRMGSYNYDALHKNTPIVKRLWIPDPQAANQGYMNANIRPVDPPYINGYRNNPFQDCFLVGQAPGAQVPMMGSANGLSHYGVTKYNLPCELHSGGLIPPNHLLEVAERDHYANAYANGLPFQRPVFLQPQRLTREPREPRIRGRRVRERRAREPVVRPEPEIREPVRTLSTSQSPAQSPEPVPDAAEQPPLPGMIFGCTSDTYIECMQMKLFALPATNKSDVSDI